MSAFTELNWKNALISVYERSVSDADFRSLCLSDAIAAIKAVSDIELPDGLKIQFFDTSDDYLYTLLLPPAATPGMDATAIANLMIRWATICTDETTHGPPIV